MQAHTHPFAAIYALSMHTDTHTPLRTLTHTVVTLTHAYYCSNVRTTCAHPYTYLKISTNINSPQLSQSLFTNICKYPHSTCHNPYNQNSILTILKIKIQSNKVDNKNLIKKTNKFYENVHFDYITRIPLK